MKVEIQFNHKILSSDMFKIMRRFKIRGMDVNKKSECHITEQDYALMEEVERRGFIRIIRK